MQIPEKGFYYHYKHDESIAWNNHAYEVTGIARHTEDKSFLVLYVPLYENDWFKPANHQARPLELWFNDVEWEGKTMPRFVRITDPAIVEKLEAVKKNMYSA